MYFIASDLAISSLVKRNSAAIKTEICFIELLRIKWYDSFSEFVDWTAEYKTILSFHVFQQPTQMSIAVSVVSDFYLSRPEASQCLSERARPDLSWHLETIDGSDRLGGNIEYKQWVIIKQWLWTVLIKNTVKAWYSNLELIKWNVKAWYSNLGLMKLTLGPIKDRSPL